MYINIRDNRESLKDEELLRSSNKSTHLVNSIFLIRLVIVDLDKLNAVLITIIVDLLHLLQDAVRLLLAIVVWGEIQ